MRVPLLTGWALTEQLRSGIDIRTVQNLVGRESLQATMRYLRPLEGDRLEAKIANSSLAAV